MRPSVPPLILARDAIERFLIEDHISNAHLESMYALMKKEIVKTVTIGLPRRRAKNPTGPATGIGGAWGLIP